MNDGWNTDKLENLTSVLNDIYSLQYEIESCVRGAYTGAHTYEELGQYIQELGNQLIEEGTFIESFIGEEDEEE